MNRILICQRQELDYLFFKLLFFEWPFVSSFNKIDPPFLIICLIDSL